MHETAKQANVVHTYLSEVQVEQCRRSHHLIDGFVGDVVVSWLHFRVQVSRWPGIVRELSRSM